MRKYGEQLGYVALLAVLVMGAISLAITTVLLVSGTNSQRETLVLQQSTQARQQATACAEEALQQIHDDTAYTGSGNLAIGAGSCNYTVTNTGGSNRTIVASGTTGSVVRRLEVTLTAGASSIAINTWQDTAGGGAATLAHVQTKGIPNNAGGGDTMQGTFDTNVTTGNTIIVAATWGNNDTGLSCADNRGNSYITVRTQYDSTNNQSFGVCYAPVTTGGSTTVTVTFGAGGVAFRGIMLSEYSGIASAAPVDVHDGQGGANGTTATDNVTSTASNTTVNGDLIYGAVIDTDGTNWNDTTIAAGTGFTERDEEDGIAVEDRVQASAGSTAATFTFNASARYNAIMVAFKAAD